MSEGRGIAAAAPFMAPASDDHQFSNLSSRHHPVALSAWTGFRHALPRPAATCGQYHIPLHPSEGYGTDVALKAFPASEAQQDGSHPSHLALLETSFDKEVVAFLRENMFRASDLTFFWPYTL